MKRSANGIQRCAALDCCTTSGFQTQTLARNALTSTISEAGAGIEPANTGFAVPCLTTWLPGRAVAVLHTRQHATSGARRCHGARARSRQLTCPRESYRDARTRCGNSRAW